MASRSGVATLAAVLLVLGAACSVVVADSGDDCVPVGVDTSVGLAIGDKFYLCVRFNGVVQTVVTPIVDDYTQINIANSSQYFPPGAGYIADGGDTPGANVDPSNLDPAQNYVMTVTPIVRGVNASFSKVYKEFLTDGNTFTFNLMTAIIHATDGIVDWIAYDEGCFFCDPDSETLCRPNSFYNGEVLNNNDYRSCALDLGACNANPRSCDLNMYVVWTGTDVNGDFFTSAGKRFSMFRSFGIESAFNSATAEVQTVSRSAAKVVENAEKIQL